MPIGTPSVPYRLPGSQMERWVDIYTRLGVERILFLGSEVNDAVANSLVANRPIKNTSWRSSRHRFLRVVLACETCDLACTSMLP